MLIAISGSQGQGKTTVLQSLNNRYNVVQNKTARSVLNDWQETLSNIYQNKDLCYKFHKEILSRHYTTCSQYCDNDEIFLIERSPADIFAYYSVVAGPYNECNEYVNDIYLDCIKLSKLFKSCILITGRTYTPVNDSVRSVNLHYCNIIDLLLKNYVPKFHNEHIIINSENHDIRIKQIKEYLNA